MTMRTIARIGIMCLAVGQMAAVAAEASRRPNIVFIFSDDHAYQAISAYGARS